MSFTRSGRMGNLLLKLSNIEEGYEKVDETHKEETLMIDWTISTINKK